jgi:hypothetical protein
LVEAQGIAWEIRPFVVICAGVRYGGLRLDPSYDHQFSHPDLKPVLIWSWDEYQEWLQARGVAPLSTEDLARPQMQLEQAHFTAVLTPEQVSWLVGNRIVVATTGFPEIAGEWRVNGDNLKDYQLYRVLGALDAFNAISAWVGGVLAGPGPNVVEIVDDEVIRDKKGFDGKSFKREKQVGSKRRKNRTQPAI